jgi:hypothetical protein
MSCLLPLIAGICLANPSELRLESHASFQVDGSYHYYVDGRDVGTGIVGTLSLSMDVPVTRAFTVRYGVAHQSLIGVSNDRGQERAYLGFTWRPFARGAL